MGDTCPVVPPSLSPKSRRDFLRLAVVVITSLAGAVTAIPLIGALIGSSFQKKYGHFTRVADLGALPVGQPVNVKYPDLTTDAYLRGVVPRAVWVIKHSRTSVTVFSPICPHLGCRYFWNPQIKEFVCPCHQSVFAPNGRVLGGPAPRPLDTLPVKIEDGQLYVKWERFVPGISQKKLA